MWLGCDTNAHWTGVCLKTVEGAVELVKRLLSAVVCGVSERVHWCRRQWLWSMSRWKTSVSKLSLVNSAIVGDGLCCAVRGCHSCWAESVRGWRYAVVFNRIVLGCCPTGVDTAQTTLHLRISRQAMGRQDWKLFLTCRACVVCVRNDDCDMELSKYSMWNKGCKGVVSVMCWSPKYMVIISGDHPSHFMCTPSECSRQCEPDMKTIREEE